MKNGAWHLGRRVSSDASKEGRQRGKGRVTRLRVPDRAPDPAVMTSLIRFRVCIMAAAARVGLADLRVCCRFGSVHAAELMPCCGVRECNRARCVLHPPARQALLVAGLREAVVQQQDGAVVPPVPDAPPHRLVQRPAAV